MMGMQPATTDFQVVTEDDKRLARANGVLFERLKNHLRGRVMTNQLYSSMLSVIGDHRFECARKGITFPQLVAVWLEGIRAVKIVRADLKQRDLEVTIANWTREHPDITGHEIARALVRHFPGYVSQVSTEVSH